MPKKRNFLGGMQNYNPRTGEYESRLTKADGEPATKENMPGGETSKKSLKSFRKGKELDLDSRIERVIKERVKQGWDLEGTFDVQAVKDMGYYGFDNIDELEKHTFGGENKGESSTRSTSNKRDLLEKEIAKNYPVSSTKEDEIDNKVKSMIKDGKTNIEIKNWLESNGGEDFDWYEADNYIDWLRDEMDENSNSEKEDLDILDDYGLVKDKKTLEEAGHALMNEFGGLPEVDSMSNERFNKYAKFLQKKYNINENDAKDMLVQVGDYITETSEGLSQAGYGEGIKWDYKPNKVEKRFKTFAKTSKLPF